MRSIGKWLGRVLTALAALIGLVWLFGPVEPVDRKITFDQSLQADQVAAYFAKAEARFDDIVPGTEKRVIWADAPGEQTPISVLYLHGFSASS